MESIGKDIVDLSGVRIACRDAKESRSHAMAFRRQVHHDRQERPSKPAASAKRRFYPSILRLQWCLLPRAPGEGDAIKHNLEISHPWRVEIQIMTISHSVYADKKHDEYKARLNKRRKLDLKHDIICGVQALADTVVFEFDEEEQ